MYSTASESYILTWTDDSTDPGRLSARPSTHPPDPRRVTDGRPFSMVAALAAMGASLGSISASDRANASGSESRASYATHSALLLGTKTRDAKLGRRMILGLSVATSHEAVLHDSTMGIIHAAAHASSTTQILSSPCVHAQGLRQRALCTRGRRQAAR